MTLQATLPRAAAARAPWWPALRFELVKMLSTGRVRLLLVTCLVAPAAFVVGISHQSSLPADTVFGRWLATSGWAGSLVVLAFAGSWALPLITSLVAGDVFAVEDRLGTWRHLLIVERSPARIFVAKTVASGSVIVALLTGLMLSSIAGGLIALGPTPLIGLDGTPLSSTEAGGTVLVAWLSVLAPTLAFAAVGLLGSVLFGRSPMGLILPALLALGMNLVLLMPVPTALRLALPSSGFLSWRGLLTRPEQLEPILLGVATSLVWAVAATGLAYVAFRRRDFTNTAFDGVGARDVVAAIGALLVLVATSALAIVPMTGGSGVDDRRLEATLSTAFAHLYRLQTDQLHRPAVTERQLATTAACDKGGMRVEDHGPGPDWRCVVTWHLPGTTATGTATYQLDVAADGRFVADGDGPKEVNGYFQVRTPLGDAPNPLWQIDGLVDLLQP